MKLLIGLLLITGSMFSFKEAEKERLYTNREEIELKHSISEIEKWSSLVNDWEYNYSKTSDQKWQDAIYYADNQISFNETIINESIYNISKNNHDMYIGIGITSLATGIYFIADYSISKKIKPTNNGIKYIHKF